MTLSAKTRRRSFIPAVFVFLIILAGVAVYVSLTAESSFFNLFRSVRRNQAMVREISDLNSTIDSLKSTIERLRNDTTYIEKIAREKLGMAKPGETVYLFVEEE